MNKRKLLKKGGPMAIRAIRKRAVTRHNSACEFAKKYVWKSSTDAVVNKILASIEKKLIGDI